MSDIFNSKLTKKLAELVKKETKDNPKLKQAMETLEKEREIPLEKLFRRMTR